MIDTTLKTFLQWIPDGPMGFGTYTSTDHTYKINGLPGLKIEVMFRALDRPEQVKNLLSLEITAAWVNEAKEVPWAIIEALTGRVGRFPSRFMGGCVKPCIIMDTNPPDDESWWYDIFEVKRPKDATIWKQPSGLSPEAENLANLPPGYYERMAGLMDKERVKVYVDGQYGFIREGMPVYPDYTDELHCTEFDVVEETDRIYRGWDFGLQPACVLSQIVDGQWRTFHEFTADSGESLDIHSFANTVINTTIREYPFIAAKKIKIRDIGDPAGNARSAVAEAGEAASSFAVLRGMGIDILGGQQSVTIRLGSVAYALKQVVKGRPAVLVHPRCKKLRRGYQGRYQYRRVAVAGSDNRYHETPDKNEFSHPHDANQYIGAELFGAAKIARGPREKVENTDRVPEAEHQMSDDVDPRTAQDWLNMKPGGYVRVFAPHTPQEIVQIMSNRDKAREQTAALLKAAASSIDEIDNSLTNEQIINRVYAHFGGAANRFTDEEWIAFARALGNRRRPEPQQRLASR